MSLFNKKIIEKDCDSNEFNKIDIINEIFEKRNSDCPEWKFFLIEKQDIKNDEIDEININNYLPFDIINSDFLAIYTSIINKEIEFNGNPFSMYKKTISSIYQTVREVRIIKNKNNNIKNLEHDHFKIITASSAKELFIKLKKEQG